MTRAAMHASAPVLFIQAQNDFDVSPSRILHAAMRRAGERSELRIYAPFGTTAQDGHAFACRGAAIWADDVHAFLNDACR